MDQAIRNSTPSNTLSEEGSRIGKVNESPMVSEKDKEAFWAKSVASMKKGLKPEFDQVNDSVAAVEHKVDSLRLAHEKRFDSIDSALAEIKKHLGV